MDKPVKIVHVASDEKFINSAFAQFEAVYKGANFFYLIVDDITAPLKYVNPNNQIFLETNAVANLKKLHEKFKDATLICFHSLNYFNSIVLNHTPSYYKTLCMFWGLEFYNNPIFFNQQDVLGIQTFGAYFKKDLQEKLLTSFKDVFRQLKYRLIDGTNSPHTEVAKAIRKVDFCGALYEEEHELMKIKASVNFDFFKFTYYPLELMIGENSDWVTGTDIMLGNSASYSNNHLEAFELLNKFNLENRKVVLPLSYGNQSYKEDILKKGETALRDHFEPLTTFLGLQEYNNYLKRCGIVIMNHYRQQAFGNIVVMLFMGAKLYLNENNTIYRFLKRMGIHVYSISDDFNADNINALEVLDNDKRIHNREVLKSLLSRNLLEDALVKQLEKIQCR
ncbi:TDP-N-acetylfucosamine:lipid II N-acetylfucosaminyltransferase [Flavobacterium chuncheonense]|uniref:TDP-N-acetylfucosamine:lipid II N-acetylfucosaminyltransferase n=1 Tax=Flavobacterium chuncheonense TaxID=2026653 RepID=A0ABW5YKB5_9FLAO